MLFKPPLSTNSFVYNTRLIFQRIQSLIYQPKTGNTMLPEIKNKNIFVNAAILVVVFMCLVNESEQQFSYSANWGKRSSPSAPEVAIGYNALRDLIEFDSQVRVSEQKILKKDHRFKKVILHFVHYPDRFWRKIWSNCAFSRAIWTI